MAVGRLITGYIPQLWATCLALGIFGVLAAVFWTRFFRSRMPKYMLCLCIGTTTMAIGFAARIPMTNQPDSLTIYIVTTLFTLLSPCAFLAHDYIVLPRLATWLDSEDCLFLRSRLIVRLFVWSDVATFLMQAAGGGLSAMAALANVGTKIALVGLIIQCVSFGVYIVLLVMFGRRVAKRTPEKWTAIVNGEKLGWKQDWRVLYWALLWTCIGIMVRCIFRVIEYAQGYQGELRTTEIYFYLLDSLPLFLAILIWVVIWPSTYLSKPCQLGRDSVPLQVTQLPAVYGSRTPESDKRSV